MQGILQGDVAQVSETAQKKFEKAMENRQLAIDEIMREAAGNFNTIKGKLRSADQRLVEVLSLVLDEQAAAEDAMVKEKSAAERSREERDSRMAEIHKQFDTDKFPQPHISPGFSIIF